MRAMLQKRPFENNRMIMRGATGGQAFVPPTPVKLGYNTPS